MEATSSSAYFYINCSTNGSPCDHQFTLSFARRFYFSPANFLNLITPPFCHPLLYFPSLGARSTALTDHRLSVLHITWPAQLHFFLSMSARTQATPACSLIHSVVILSLNVTFITFHSIACCVVLNFFLSLFVIFKVSTTCQYRQYAMVVQFLL